MVCGQFVDLHPLGIICIRSADNRTLVRVAEIVDDDEVIGDTAVRRVLDSIQHFDYRPDLDGQSGLFKQFPGDRGLQRFPELHGTTGQAPLAFQWFVCAFGQKNVTFAIEHHGSNADDRFAWKASQILKSSNSQILRFPDPQIPMTLTITRFFRWPSNSP